MPNWTNACSVDDVGTESVIRFDHENRTFAIYHGPDGEFYCTDGLCSHEKVHLSGGEVIGHEIECPKHSAVFDYRTGEVLTPPACFDLKAYPVKVEDGRVWIDIG